jgi:hypothetical protein
VNRFLGIVPAKDSFKWVELGCDVGSDYKLIEHKLEKIPEYGSRHKELAWVFRQVTEVHASKELSGVCVVQGAVGQNRSDALLQRAQVEGVVLAALATISIPVHSQKKSKILTEFGFKPGTDISLIEGLERIRETSGLPKSFSEAIAASMRAARIVGN